MPHRTESTEDFHDRRAANSRTLIFKLAITKAARIVTTSEYRLIIGAQQCHSKNKRAANSAYIIIDSGVVPPLKSHATWVQRLIDKLATSGVDPKLKLIRSDDQELPLDTGRLWLTQREQQMLRLRYLGLTAKESAVQFKISYRTVEKQLETAKGKLGLEKLTPHLLNSLFNSVNIIEQHLVNHPPAIPKQLSR